MKFNFNTTPIKQAHKVKPFTQPSKRQTNQYSLPSFKTNINTSIPTKPQYHPLGSTIIPGADLKVATNQMNSIRQPALSAISKTAGLKELGNKFIKETTTPLNIGLSTMNIASGETSIGGELGGQISSFIARKATDPLLNKIYTEGITPKTNVRRLGKGALGLVTSISGYIGGNYLGNRFLPVFRRKDPNNYVPTVAEVGAINRIYNKGMYDGTIKTASFGSTIIKSIKDNVNKAKLQYKNKISPKVNKVAPYTTMVGALGVGNMIYRDKQRQAKENFYNSLAQQNDNKYT